MEESILLSVKKVLGIDPGFTDFDLDIIMHINSVLLILRQLGIGPEGGYIITGPNDLWTDYLPNIDQLAAVKTYICLKVRHLFDPPVGGALDALTKAISELEWRLNVEVDPGKKD